MTHLRRSALVSPISMAMALSLAGCLTDPAETELESRFDDLEEPTLDDDDAELLANEHLDRLAPQRSARLHDLATDRAWVDKLGTAHARVSQSVDGIPVFGAAAVLHMDAGGELSGMTDGLVEDIDVATTPWLERDWAIAQAIDLTGGRARLSDEPTADLTILRHDGVDHLAYQVKLSQMRGPAPAQPVVFVDAHDGEIVWDYDALQYGAPKLQTGDYATWDMLGGTDFGAAVIGDTSDLDLYEAHKAVATTLKFLMVEVGRDSYDGAGAEVNTYGHYDTAYSNAFWDPSANRLVLGDGDGVWFGHFGTLDVVAHELAHGVVNSEAGLINSGESGALGETTGDIMAAAVADYSNKDWVFDIGEDCWLPGDPSQAIRYMGRPSDDGSSRDHYSDRYTGKADNGGVHFNTGIGNHFFFLLSEGGKHHDPEFRSGLVVDGIGIEKAFAIWYRALTVYMVPSTDFAEARLATVKAADDLYDGYTVQQVETAWHEVGVGKAP